MGTGSLTLAGLIGSLFSTFRGSTLAGSALIDSGFVSTFFGAVFADSVYLIRSGLGSYLIGLTVVCGETGFSSGLKTGFGSALTSFCSNFTGWTVSGLVMDFAATVGLTTGFGTCLGTPLVGYLER